MLHSGMRNLVASLATIALLVVMAARPGTAAEPTVDTAAGEASRSGPTDRPAPPNILWIWADNLGYGDLSCYGSESIETPVIDRLAADGARFTQYYIAHAVCSPSRAALLTGRQPFRVGIVDVLRPDGPDGIPANEITLGEALRAQGYATMAIGKWHLGDQVEFLPKQHGFDGYFGIPYSMDMLPTILIRDDEIIERLPGEKVADITERYTREAIRFIGANRDRPFFLYLSHTIPHPPITLPEQFQDSDRPLYDCAIEYMDQQIGVLLEELQRAGLRENTLVVVSSDNGPMHRDGSPGVLRGRIGTSLEGGVRVPLVANWPGRIPSGRVVDTPAIAYDIFPTLVRLAGGELADDRTYDGQDIWPLLCGEGEAEFARQKPFFWVFGDRISALRDGRWKLHLARRDRPLKRPELYDLSSDPGESKNLAEENPKVVGALLEKAAELQADIPKVWSLRYPVRDPAKRPSGVRRE
jgi:arylsulfatase A-like enzyme